MGSEKLFNGNDMIQIINSCNHLFIMYLNCFSEKRKSAFRKPGVPQLLGYVISGKSSAVMVTEVLVTISCMLGVLNEKKVLLGYGY